MDISKLRNYLGHDCFFNITTDSTNRAICFEYGNGNNLVEICLVSPSYNQNRYIYHTILRLDGSTIDKSKNYPIIDEIGVSIRTSLTPNILYIVPNDTNLFGDWEVYLRVFGDTDLKLPPKNSSNTDAGTDISSYISTPKVFIGQWLISEDDNQNLIFKKI